MELVHTISVLMFTRVIPISVAMLALRAAAGSAPRSWAIWPHGQPLDADGWATQALMNNALAFVAAVVLLRQERRLFEAWCVAKRAARAAKLE